MELGKGVFSEWRENLELSKCTHFRTLLELLWPKCKIETIFHIVKAYRDGSTAVLYS